MDINPRRAKRRFACLLAAALAATPPAWGACLGMQLHAHRGANAPENSLSALAGGYQAGYDGVETDLQMLADGQWVIHHDPLTGRVVQTGLPQPVRGLRSADWRMARMNLRGTASAEAPPFLSDVTRVAAGFPQQAFNAEIKTLATCKEVHALAAQLRGEVGHGNWFLTSISEVNLRCARQADPEGYLGLLVLDPRNAEALGSNRYTRAFARKSQAPRLDLAWLTRVRQRVGAPMGIHVDARTLDGNPDLLTDAATLGMPVFVYAVAGDADLAASLKRARQRSGAWPSGAIIDGGAQAFCARLQ